jgi:hypothetical protein
MDQTGTFAEATSMDVDRDPQGRGTPPDTSFDEGYTPSTTRGQTTAGATGSVHTESYFTPLYNESQTTDHSNVNINQQPPTPKTTRDVEMAAAAEEAAAVAKESASTYDAEMEASASMEAEATSTVELQTTNDTEAEAAAANVAEFVARLATETEAATTDEAASIKAGSKAAATATA